MSQIPRILSRLQVQSMVGMSDSLLAKEQRLGFFPLPIKISSSTGKSGAVGWIESEVIAYIERKIAESRPVIDAEISAIPPAHRDAGAAAAQHGG